MSLWTRPRVQVSDHVAPTTKQNKTKKKYVAELNPGKNTNSENDVNVALHKHLESVKMTYVGVTVTSASKQIIDTGDAAIGCFLQITPPVYCHEPGSCRVLEQGRTMPGTAAGSPPDAVSTTLCGRYSWVLGGYGTGVAA